MKAIISGKRYDTETATKVASWKNGGSWRDFGHIEEELYRKRTGEYFIYGEGGAATEYREYGGSNSWTGGEKIKPLTIAEAKRWAEEKLSADEYETIFGKVDEDAEPSVIVVQLDAERNAKLRNAAAERGINLTAMVKDMIDML